MPRTDKFAFLSSRKARIRVDESFGGLAADAHEVEVLTGSGGGDCGVAFRTDEVYLISAGVGDDGLLHAGICGATRKIEFAEAVVRVLRQRRDQQLVPTLIGGIAQYNRNFEGLLGMHAPIRLPNTLIRVKADGRVYETQSDPNGLSFFNLPSGKYEFARSTARNNAVLVYWQRQAPQFLLRYTPAPARSETWKCSPAVPSRGGFSIHQTI